MAPEAQPATELMAVSRRLTTLEEEFGALRSKLLGTKGVEVGLIDEMRAEIKDMYKTVGRMEKILLGMKRAIAE